MATTGQASRPMTDDEKVLAEKSWVELSPEQKIERLCSVLRSYEYLMHQFSSLKTTVFQLEQHQHGKDGEIVIPYGKKNSSGLSAGSERVYNPYNKLY